MLAPFFPFKLNWGSYIVYIAKTASKKKGTLNYSLKVLSPEVAFISVNLPYYLASNTVVMSRLALLTATWIGQMTHGYVRMVLPLTSTHLVLPLIAEMQQVLLWQVFFIAVTIVEVHLNWLNWFYFLILVADPLDILIGCCRLLYQYSQMLQGCPCQHLFPLTVML